MGRLKKKNGKVRKVNGKVERINGNLEKYIINMLVHYCVWIDVFIRIEGRD